MVIVSILTPTHNRANLLPRLFNSLKKQTNKNIEWIIFDDGSTDNTREIVMSLINQCDEFPIRYYYQENKGKYTAMNKLYDLAQGKYSFQIDDDDELIPTAVEEGLKLWNDLKDADQYWCVVGRCIYDQTKEIVGPLYPNNINEIPERKQKRLLNKIGGDKCGLQKVEIVRHYKFPALSQCTFIPEGFLWRTIDLDYKQYYTNEKFSIYYQHNGPRLSDLKVDAKYLVNAFYIYKYALQTKHLRPTSLRQYLIYIVFLRMAVVKNKELKNMLYNDLSFIDSLMIFLLKIPALLVAKKKNWL